MATGEPHDVEQIRVAFAKIKVQFDARRSDGLVCKQGFYKGSAVLKLQKASWTNDRMDRVENQTGIFFSIWVDSTAARLGQAHYNVHALKLRHLTGYSITSRDFADDFRRRFAPQRRAWPHVRVDYGPLTLMQGWIETTMARVGRDALVLVEQFQRVSPLIDQLLEARRR